MVNESIITALYTISGAILIYLFSEWIKLRIIDPYNDFKGVKGEIAKLLVLYANIYSNPVSNDVLFKNDVRRKELLDIGFQLRTVAAKYTAVLEVLPMKNIRQFIREIPSDKENNELIGSLIGLSNALSGNKESLSIMVDSNVSRVNKIQEILNYKIVSKI